MTDQLDGNSPLVIGKAKFIYNSGQPIQAASLLYNITNGRRYLNEATATTHAAYAKWFTLYNSPSCGKLSIIIKPNHVWFQAIALRGFIKLFKIDNDPKYVNAYKFSIASAWLSSARNLTTNLVNSEFRVETTQPK